MVSFQDKKSFYAFSDTFMRLAAWDAVLANIDINKKHPQITPSRPSNQITREKTPGCSGEYFIASDLTSRLKRIRIGFYTSAQLAAGWLALAQGAAAAPSGTPADEVQTITVTGDPWTISFSHEGLSGTTPNLAQTGITAAAVQAALNALVPIHRGSRGSINAAVTGSAGGPFTVTFQNKLAKANVPALGATNATIATTTPGANNMHPISRTSSDQPPVTSIIYGYEGDSDNPFKLPQVVVNEIAATGQPKLQVLIELDLIAAWPIDAGVYDAPVCVNFKPIATRDCRLKVNNEWVTELREFRYVFSNNIIDGDDPFPYYDIDAIRLESGNRTSNLTWTEFGTPKSPRAILAEEEPLVPTELHIGNPGDRLTIFAPSANLRQQDAFETWIGDANRSGINFEAEPFEGGAGTPDHAEAYLDQATAFLTT